MDINLQTDRINDYIKKLIVTVAPTGSLPMNLHAVMMGEHVRVGLEDNIYYKKGQLATNEALVERIVRLSGELGREVATPDEARELLYLH